MGAALVDWRLLVVAWRVLVVGTRATVDVPAPVVLLLVASVDEGEGFAFARAACGSQSAEPSSVGVAGNALVATENAPEFVGHAGAVFVGV